ncbi:hypothetical protein [Sphingorhabdus sp. Alg239-R122]|uniref:hypothetical protein n=1 Tax=Sphingorhabdus sp. Alg239-R122 TaxID=2305989 RepID=UPI0013DABE6F|nr:hypothetical protein [Sphingorhabdus sp. Alg239-R122]
MGRIIKSGSERAFEAVRPFSKIQTAANVSQELESNAAQEQQDTAKPGEDAPQVQDAAEARLEALETSYAELEKKYILVKEEIENVRLESFEKGKVAGAENSTAKAQVKHEQLGKASQEALELFSQKLESLDGLAAALTHEGLAKIFDSRDDLSDLVVSAISNRIRQIKDETILSVVVSADDFPDSGQARARIPGLQDDVELRCDPSLESGDCRIKLSLGILEIAPELQVTRLRELLQQLANGG